MVIEEWPTISRVVSRARRALSKPDDPSELDRPVVAHKAALIKKAYKHRPFRSFADLGACWGVNAGYAIYARKLCGSDFDRAFIVDQIITSISRDRVSKWDNFFPVQAILGSAEARTKVGPVDALIIFDILLHQANPDWRQFLKDWLAQTKQTVIVYNQNWFKDATSVRFFERGPEWYLKNVVYVVGEPKVREWFANPYRFIPEEGVNAKDSFHFWQWGITPADLIDEFQKNGFDLVSVDTFNAWGGHPWIINQGLIFGRSQHR